MDTTLKEITILSGKGGTGKTSIAAAFASLASNAIFCDNDVDAADLHLILKPAVQKEFNFDSGDKSVIDKEKCSACGLCIDYCRFGAITRDSSGFPSINKFKCEGCRLCERLCPNEAISTISTFNNQWFISNTRFGTLIHAHMGPGEENSGKLVSKLREEARIIAKNSNTNLIVNDGPPGIGCPVIASLTGTDIVLLITEPSVSGLHDAFRMSELIHSFHLPLLVIINKYDINLELTAEIEQTFKKKNVHVIGKIPFDERLVEAMVESKSITEFSPGCTTSKVIRSAWEKLNNLMYS